LIRKGFNDNVIGNPRNGNWEMKNDWITRHLDLIEWFFYKKRLIWGFGD
jgi:hypothetical protein